MVEKIADTIRTADWKAEKHVPVITAPEKVAAGDWFTVVVTIGKAVVHPNTTEHHIRWIQVLFSPDGDKFVYDVGRFHFNAHGESVDGPNTGPLYTNHEASFSFKTSKAGTIHAVSYCNIHGLWESSQRLELA
jgi:superoxide reductase